MSRQFTMPEGLRRYPVNGVLLGESMKTGVVGFFLRINIITYLFTWLCRVFVVALEIFSCGM